MGNLEKRIFKTAGQGGLLLSLAIVFIGTGIVASTIRDWRYNSLYEKAATHATYSIGDKKPPFSSQEESEWYRTMGTKKKANTNTAKKLYWYSSS